MRAPWTLWACCVLVLVSRITAQQALLDYVAKPDAHYQWLPADDAQHATRVFSNVVWYVCICVCRRDTGFRYTNQSGWTGESAHCYRHAPHSLFAPAGYLLNMTSQQWLTTEVSDRSIWTHQLLVSA